MPSLSASSVANFSPFGENEPDRAGRRREIRLRVGDRLEGVQREDLGAGVGGGAEDDQGRGAADVAEEGRDVMLEQSLGGRVDLVVGDAEQDRLGAVAGGGEVVAAADADLDPGAARRARQGAARAAVADDREHQLLRCGSLL